MVYDGMRSSQVEIHLPNVTKCSLGTFRFRVRKVVFYLLTFFVRIHIIYNM